MISRTDIEDMTDAQDEAPERMIFADGTTYVRADLARPSQAGDEPDMFWWADDGEYFYHDPQEALDQAGFDEVVQLDCAKRLPPMWAATVCVTLDEHGGPDKTEARLFATEEEAKRAWSESVAALAAMDTPKGGEDE